MLFTAGVATTPLCARRSDTPAKRPNVIFFALDDLCDWVGPLGHSQAITPNFDRLAKSGVTFTNAHTAGVFCAPSRTAIFTGRHVSTTGCYREEVFYYDHPNIVTMQMVFQQGGYKTFGAGKLYHHMPGFIDLRGWDEYFTRSQEVKDMGWQMNGYHMKDVPLPEKYPHSPIYTKGGRKISSAGFLEWGPIPDDRAEKMVDTIRTNWACDVLRRKHGKPFFLALGLYTPHYPNYAPQKYFDLYDRDSLKLPPYKEDDLEDLSPAIRKKYQRRPWQKQLEKYGAVKDAIHGYLAAVSYGDALLGRVLDTLERSPHKDNTIIVLWSDHGFHHGQKNQWGKHTLWERTSNVPFIWAGKGIARNAEVKTTVSLIDMYPTFLELCSLPMVRGLEGTSLAAALRDPSRAADRNVLLPHMERGSYAVMNTKWRYIHYNDGAEELYNVKKDPHEWYNLANDEKYRKIKERLRASAPKAFAPHVTSRRELKLIIKGDSFHWEKR
jgi:arylsulfatase A-like enzyme